TATSQPPAHGHLPFAMKEVAKPRDPGAQPPEPARRAPVAGTRPAAVGVVRLSLAGVSEVAVAERQTPHPVGMTLLALGTVRLWHGWAPATGPFDGSGPGPGAREPCERVLGGRPPSPPFFMAKGSRA